MHILVFMSIVGFVAIGLFIWAKKQTAMMAKGIAMIFAAPFLLTVISALIFPFFFGFNGLMGFTLLPLLIPVIYSVKFSGPQEN
jgi:hypothetical protein